MAEFTIQTINPPTISNITVDSTSISITSTNTTTIKWISQGVQVYEGNSLPYNDIAMDKYVRAVIYGAGGVTFTQPFGVTNNSSSTPPSSSSPSKTVTSIAMKTNPTKTAYIQGQDLDLTGAKITVSYSDSTAEDISIGAGMVTGYNKNTIGQQTLTVNYLNKTTTFNVTVRKKGDITGDNKVTAVDALQALQAASGRRTLTDIEKAAADVNGDGKATTVDALKILQFASGRITSF